MVEEKLHLVKARKHGRSVKPRAAGNAQTINRKTLIQNNPIKLGGLKLGFANIPQQPISGQGKQNIGPLSQPSLPATLVQISQRSSLFYRLLVYFSKPLFVHPLRPFPTPPSVQEK